MESDSAMHVLSVDSSKCVCVCVCVYACVRACLCVFIYFEQDTGSTLQSAQLRIRSGLDYERTRFYSLYVLATDNMAADGSSIKLTSTAVVGFTWTCTSSIKLTSTAVVGFTWTCTTSALVVQLIFYCLWWKLFWLVWATLTCIWSCSSVLDNHSAVLPCKSFDGGHCLHIMNSNHFHTFNAHKHCRTLPLHTFSMALTFDQWS